MLQVVNTPQQLQKNLLKLFGHQKPVLHPRRRKVTPYPRFIFLSFDQFSSGFSAKDIAKNPAMARMFVLAAKKMKEIQIREGTTQDIDRTSRTVDGEENLSSPINGL
jgi:hypothetical protein